WTRRTWPGPRRPDLDGSPHSGALGRQRQVVVSQLPPLGSQMQHGPRAVAGWPHGSMPGARRAGGVRRGDPDRSTVAEHERRVGPLLSDLHQALDHPYPQLGERLTATAPRVASCAGGGDDLGLLLLHVRDAPARPGAHADLTETR